jgi:cysteine desulfurase/selenocysteine lyase
MSTADYAKHAYSAAPSADEALLTRLVNEIYRTPAGGMGPSPNFADPAAGGIGLSPGALTTHAPAPITEPTPVQSAIPSGSPPDLSAGHVLAATLPKPSLGGPSTGGAGVSPGAAQALPGFGAPGLAEPQRTSLAQPSGSSKPADYALDDLVAQAGVGTAYTGPSLSGLGASPGIVTSDGSGSPAVGTVPYGGAAALDVDPLGLDSPENDILRSLAIDGSNQPAQRNGVPASAGYRDTPLSGSDRGAPASNSDRGVPASAGYRETPTASADRGAPVSTRERGGPAATGYQGAPASNGYQGSHGAPASASGDGASTAAGNSATPASVGRPSTPEYYFDRSSPSRTDGKADESALRRFERKPARDPKFASAHPPFDVHAIRRDFPILSEKVNGKPLIWFDNAATTQKPKAVIDRLSCFYEHENSNIHRAAHELAARATDAYEDARETVRRFLNAPSVDSIVFARGTTEAINLVAQSWGRQHIGPGDEIIITHLEHHANIVPWQMLCWEKGAKIRVAPVDDFGQVRLDEYQKLFNSRTRLVSFTHVSNALGTVTPAKDMIDIARRYNVKVLLDGAQSVSHKKVDVQELDPDFFVFSGHKIFGPTGIGALYGKPEVLNAMQPWQGGGNMIADVTFERTLFQPAPLRFEAGTGNIADAVGLAAALEYVERIGLDKIDAYEHSLVEYATHHLSPIPGLTIVGRAKEKASVVSFVLDGYESEEVGAALNAEGIAVRSGHHCAQPILRRFGHETTVRPSFAFYNTFDEIDLLVDTVRKLAVAK